MATVTELITELGINIQEGSLKKIDNFEEKLTGVSGALDKIGKWFTGGKSIADFFGGVLTSYQNLENTAKAIGLSTDALQEWQYAATASGVSASSVTEDLDHLHNEMFLSEKGVLNLADSFKKMSAEGARLYGSRLGISRDTVLLLRQGSEAIKELQARAPKLTGEQIKKNAELKKKLEASKKELETLAQTVVSKVTPALLKMFDTFNKWLGDDPERSEFVIKGITLALAGMTAGNLITGILNLTSALNPLIGLLAKMPFKFMGIAGAIAGASLAAIELYKDFQKFQNGEDSLIPWKPIVEACDKIREALDNIGLGIINDAVEGIWKTIQSAMGGVAVFVDWLANDRTWAGLQDRFKALDEGIWSNSTNNLRNEIGIRTTNGGTITETMSGNALMTAGTAPATTFTGTTVNIYSSQNIGEIINGLNETLSNESGPVLSLIQ